MNHETEVKREDSKVIHELFSEWCGEGTIGVLKHKLAEYVATVRRDEREAERSRTLKVIQKLPATAAGADAFRKKLIEELYREAAALQASASKKGEMNG